MQVTSSIVKYLSLPYVFEFSTIQLFRLLLTAQKLVSSARTGWHMVVRSAGEEAFCPSMLGFRCVTRSFEA